jgi:hypothetical protein
MAEPAVHIATGSLASPVVPYLSAISMGLRVCPRQGCLVQLKIAGDSSPSRGSQSTSGRSSASRPHLHCNFGDRSNPGVSSGGSTQVPPSWPLSWDYPMAWRIRSCILDSRPVLDMFSAANRLPVALSAVMLSSSRSWASGGRNASRRDRPRRSRVGRAAGRALMSVPRGPAGIRRGRRRRQPLSRMMACEVAAEQITSVVTAVGRPHNGVHVERLRLIVV